MRLRHRHWILLLALAAIMRADDFVPVEDRDLAMPVLSRDDTM